MDLGAITRTLVPILLLPPLKFKEPTLPLGKRFARGTQSLKSLVRINESLNHQRSCEAAAINADAARRVTE